MNTIHAEGVSYAEGVFSNLDFIFSLLLVIVLFVLAGAWLASSMFVPVDYQIFW